MLAKSLKKRGHKLDVFDYNVSSKEFRREYNLNIINNAKKSYYDAVLITVAHKKFKFLKKIISYPCLKISRKG